MARILNDFGELAESFEWDEYALAVQACNSLDAMEETTDSAIADAWKELGFLVVGVARAGGIGRIKMRDRPKACDEATMCAAFGYRIARFILGTHLLAVCYSETYEMKRINSERLRDRAREYSLGRDAGCPGGSSSGSNRRT